jgi:hypothetical protein
MRPLELDSLRESIERFGMVEPIVVNDRRPGVWTDGASGLVVVGGHSRLKVLVQLGWAKVPVHRIDVDEEAERVLNLALNRVKGDFVPDRLAQAVAWLNQRNANMADLLAKVNGATATPEVPFATELDEANNYVVLQFKSQTDWLQALTVLGLKTVKVMRADGVTIQTKGLGRVLDGPEVIDRIVGGRRSGAARRSA